MNTRIILFALIACPAIAAAQTVIVNESKTTVTVTDSGVTATVTGDGAATVLSVGAQGPPGLTPSASSLVLNIKDYGAIGNGAADDTTAIQAGLNAAAANHCTLFFPVGTYKITSTLSLVQKTHFTVRGSTKQAGAYSSIIRWAGALGGTMLLLDGVRDSEWTDLALDGGVALIEPAVILDIDKISAGTTISRKNGFRRMLLRGGSTATVRIANTSVTNNEAHVFEDVLNAAIVAKNGYGYQVKNINAKGIQIVRGEISGKTTAVQIDAGSIHLHSVEISGSDIWLGGAGNGEPTVIENCDGDSSTTFFALTGSSSNPVIAMGNRFIQRTDGDLFSFTNNSGPVILLGNDFASGGYRAGATTTITGNGPRMVAIGNTFPNADLLPFPDVTLPHFLGLYALANWAYVSAGVKLPSDDVLTSYQWAADSYGSILLGGAWGTIPEQQSITVANQTIMARTSGVTFTAPAPLTLTATPTIASGKFDGQQIMLMNVGANSITIQDRGTLAGSALALTANTVTVAPRQSLALTWSATLGLWIQTGPLVEPL